MALRDQPYLPLYIQDFLTDEKLIECSAQTTGFYVRLMCIMHKSEQYGQILLKQKDKQTTEQIKNFALKIAKQVPYSLDVVQSSLNELLAEGVVHIEGDFLCQKRMMRDNLISLERSKAGKKGGEFAQAKVKAKVKANTENESVIEIETEIGLKESFEKKFETAFDEITLENFRNNFPKLDLTAELTHFMLKCNSAKNEYHTRDPDGLRLGFLNQLKNSKSFINGKSGIGIKQEQTLATANAVIEHYSDVFKKRPDG